MSPPKTLHERVSTGGVTTGATTHMLRRISCWTGLAHLRKCRTHKCLDNCSTAALVSNQVILSLSGGVLASLSDEMQQKMGDDEDGALKALEQLPEALQEALTLLIDIANTAVINASNGVGLDEIAGKVADFISPVPSKDDGQL
eukprot:COSAG02_NODE_28108_length_596_cov_0.863179_1_plen_143_part_10